MNEIGKTIAFVAAAVVVIGIARYLDIPSTPASTAEAHTGEFFPQWKDALAATNLEITEYDEDTGTPHQFKVMQVDGKWSIPSHANYPADAQRQLAEAATSVIGLEKLGLATTNKDEHELYGVVDPDPKHLKGGEEGVGKRVTLEDSSGKKLADLIIGKAVEGQPNIYYVREPGSDAVYRSEIKPEKLTTKFEDWIEKDLLKLNSFDIKQVVLNNYSIDEINRRISKADILELTYDSDKSKWLLDKASEGEVLDDAKLNEMKTALDDLKIVDVRRKPDGLSEDLKAEEGINLDPEALQSLVSKGFIFVQGSLLSNEGEAIVRMKDGVTYVLRFGEIAADTGSPDDKKDDKQKDKAADKQAGDESEEEATGSNRYIFVTAQFDESLIEKPELAALPGESPAPEENKADDKQAGDKASEASGCQEAAEEPKADAKSEEPDAAKTDEKAGAKKADAEQADEKKADDAQSQEEKEDEAAARKRELDKKRKEIEKENKRKQDEYDDKVKKGQERVKELNSRFADWYYVISDDVYHKIHLTRAEIVKENKDDAAKANGIDALNKIKEQGVEGAADDAADPAK
jgi:hypothetical protein